MSEEQSKKKKEVTKKLEPDVVENNPELNKEFREVIAEVVQSEFSGPIPPPSIIKGYEEVLPGSADRIIKMAENQSSHRQAMESKMVKTEARDSLLGEIFAFILGMSCIIAAIIIVLHVPESSGAIASSVLGMTGIGAIVITLIKSTRTEKKK